MDKVILHCDCNSFFASVETVAHPEYKTLPMAVCGSKEERHGVVLAKNDLAKKSGVITGEPICKAQKKCPGLVIAPPHPRLYDEYSKEVNKIYFDYTDMVEPFGIDESWLDVTGSTNLFGSGKTIADEIRERIKKELGITISAGVSFNKTFAKLGSDYKKPDATTVIGRDTYRQILFPLPVGDMMYIGRHTVPKLKMLGINTIGDLASADEGVLTSFFGKMGRSLYNACNGRDESEVITTPPPPKSYGNGMTFLRDLKGEEDFRKAVAFLADRVTGRMREGGYKCRTVSVTVRDANFLVKSRQKKLSSPVSSSVIVEETAIALILGSFNTSLPVRSLQVACGDLTDGKNPNSQLCFVYTKEEEREKRLDSLDGETDRLRALFGRDIIKRASFIGNDLGI
ncbi:MAG: DNA polymerase IV [Eubacteriales bacterium]